jgi:nitrite reductase/ring-hydroxylating ferredoxin subunit
MQRSAEAPEHVDRVACSGSVVAGPVEPAAGPVAGSGSGPVEPGGPVAGPVEPGAAAAGSVAAAGPGARGRGDREVRVEQVSEDEIRLTAGGRTFLVAAACPHRKGRLAFAHVNPVTLRITCPLHKSTYDLRTGRRISGPTTGDLPVREVDPC